MAEQISFQDQSKQLFEATKTWEDSLNKSFAEDQSVYTVDL